MQLYSISHRKKVFGWEWNNQANDQDSGYVLATRFTNDGNFVVAGGGQTKNELKVFMNNADSSATFKP